MDRSFSLTSLPPHNNIQRNSVPNLKMKDKIVMQLSLSLSSSASKYKKEKHKYQKNKEKKTRNQHPKTEHNPVHNGLIVPGV